MLKFLNEVKEALLLIFNAGIIWRMIMILTSGMGEEDPKPIKRSLKNHMKAAIIVNLAAVLVYMFKRYFG